MATMTIDENKLNAFLGRFVTDLGAAVHIGMAVIGGAAVPRITEALRSGDGMGWHEHDARVHEGCEKFFRPGYVANLVRGGFRRFRRAAETPFNLVFEARP